MSATGVRTPHPLAGSNNGPALCSTPRTDADGDRIYSNSHHNHHQADITSKPFRKTALNSHTNLVNNDNTGTTQNNKNNMTSNGTLPLFPRLRKGGAERKGGGEGGRHNPSPKGQPHASTTTTTTTTTAATTTTIASAVITTTTTTPYLPRMSAEAQHAITETLKEMETGEGGREKQRKEGEVAKEEEEKEADLEEGWQRLDNVGVEEDDVFVQDDEDDNDAKSISSLPSVGDPLPSLPAQRRSWHPVDTGSTLGQSRENSLTFSQRTAATTTRLAAYRQHSRHGDQGSTLTTPAKGAGRTPRRNRARVLQGGGDGGQLNGVDLDLLSTAAQSQRSSPSPVNPEATTAAVPRMHLPAITTSRTEPKNGVGREHQHVRHVNYRIRGVGSYRVARENTFEITGPGFDVRYRDVISCQRGARDTPPPEIFDKAVGKVQEWLSKHYSPYSPS